LVTAKGAAKFFKEKVEYTLGPAGLARKIESKDKGIVIVDVRDSATYKKGHITGAINAFGPEIEKHFKKLPKNKTLVVYCYDITCFLAPRTALKLAKKGYKVMELFGGFDEWKKKGFPIKKG